MAEPAPDERPTPSQLRWLASGMSQPGGKLPLFDSEGQRISERTVRACLDKGWAEPWFANPIKPDWLVCKLTPSGRARVEKAR
ncbi:MAG: hypothetical protein H7841_14250 [Magnetospirillum sp. WYHS-4]